MIKIILNKIDQLLTKDFLIGLAIGLIVMWVIDCIIIECMCDNILKNLNSY